MGGLKPGARSALVSVGWLVAGVAVRGMAVADVGMALASTLE